MLITCPHCGSKFRSGFPAQKGVTIIGCSETCRTCGRVVSTPDSIDGELIRSSLRAIRSLHNAREQLEGHLRILEQVTSQEQLDRLRNDVGPVLAVLSPSNLHQMPLYISLLLAILILLQERNVETIDSDKILQMMNKTSAIVHVDGHPESRPMKSPKLRESRESRIDNSLTIELGDVELVLRIASSRAEYWSECNELADEIEKGGVSNLPSDVMRTPKYQEYLTVVLKNGDNLLAWAILLRFIARSARHNLRRGRAFAKTIMDELVLKDP